MTVTAQNPYKSYTAAPFAVTFSTEFRVIRASDLVVRVNGLTQTSGFTLFGLGAPAGVDVTFTVPMVGGELVELLREVPLTRATDYQIAGDFLSPVVNIDFDRLWMAMQGLGRRIATSLRVPFSEQIGELPPLAQRANRYLAFNASGEPVAVEGTSSDVVVTPFAQGLLDDTTDEAARTTLGASAVGSNVFTAADAAAARSAIGALRLATAAEASAGTDGTLALSPLRLRDALAATGAAPIYACRAWVNFNGTGTVAIRASGNVSSITDNDVGDYTVNFTTPLPDGAYAVSVTSGPTGVASGIVGCHIANNLTTQTASLVRVRTYEYPAYSDSAYVNVAIFR